MKHFYFTYEESGLDLYCLVFRNYDNAVLVEVDDEYSWMRPDDVDGEEYCHPLSEVVVNGVATKVYRFENEENWNGAHHSIFVYNQAGEDPNPSTDELVGQACMLVQTGKTLDKPFSYTGG